MKHVIIGGDGFVGRHLARDLVARDEEVVIASLEKSDLEIYERVPFVRVDVTDPATFDAVPIEADDVVYNLSARMLSPIPPRSQRRDFFYAVNYHGQRNVLEYMARRDCSRLVYFTTDMVYGPTKFVPQTEDHPKEPLGPYGASKLESETLCEEYRERGMNISIFRPRLIIGPGRLGILTKLFRLIDLNLPVPVIGNGENPYQFISVYDCASACVAAWEKGCPNSAYNLGSLNPPSVKELLSKLIEGAGSRSFILKTPAGLVKTALTVLDRLGMPLMDPEQYLIADEVCIVDVSKAERELGWVPQHRDEDMLLAAYREYRTMRDRGMVAAAPQGG